MEQHSIVPDVLEDVSEETVLIEYGHNVQVELGNELFPRDTKDAPINVSWPTEPGSLYTLVMVDPDAPSREERHKLGQVIHWLVCNIPGTDLSLGETYFEYLGPNTPEGTGLHRYVYVIYKQTNVLTLDIETNRNNRIRFDLKKFAKQYNLSEPIAANFFRAQFDETIRHRLAVKSELAFKVDEVVPHCLDRAPLHVAQVHYDSGVMMNLGTELTPTQVQNEPSVKWPTEPDQLYTLIFTDLDVPNRSEPKFREILHWLVVNISGNDIANGDCYAGYIGAGAPKESGLHRYVLLVFKQPNGRIELDRPKIGSRVLDGRYAFKTRHLIDEYKFNSQPIAGNYFQAQYDDYCPILHAQFEK
ncbi:hypothetical protein RDWZM_006543 [Blomia tropicalis]|uniref:Uncharacterized protein n=1 Tax=Blomia tropicalis TaxID=40697 RepID=A0A9Q0RNH8_BLOTA|nr:hypothetical protein RDWZM_006543 [Blomia tropicalis]